MVPKDNDSRDQLAAKALEDSEARMRAIVDTAVDAIITIDEQGRIDSFNRSAERLFGYSANEMIGKSVNLLMPSPYREQHDSYLAAYLATGSKKIIGIGREVVARRKDGTIFPIELAVSEVRLSDRRVFTGFIRDITERKRAEETLAVERELLAVTLRSVADGVITTDVQGRVLLLSRVAEKLTGWTQAEAHGQPLTDVFRILDDRTRESQTPRIRRLLQHDGFPEFPRNVILLSKDGSERRIDNVYSPLHDRLSQRIGLVVAFRDVTERQKLEQEILKADKLESIGLLAGGIAHDFNNFLSEILVNINLAKMSLDPSAESFPILTEAERAAVRAKDLTHQLLTFSKGGAPIKRPVNLGKLLRETARFAVSGSSVRCEFNLQDGLWTVEADEGQISQVINNLILNAVQAMPSGGTIRINAENTRIEPGNPGGLVQGRHVRVEIVDQGVGIPPEQLGRIFDPYFTTKAGGSGLGLATTYSILRRHEGHIEAESEPGRGTTFTILLPASTSAAPDARQRTEEPVPGRGKVLLMEDSDGLRIATAKMLTRLGYEVETARDGDAAIQSYRDAMSSGCPFDAVIMDLTITGGMGGKETMQQLLQIDPSVRAIAASGYSTDPIMAQFRDYGFSGMMSKPFGKHELAEVLQNVIGTKPASG